MDKLPILNHMRIGVNPPSEPRIATAGMDKEKLRKACTEFEAIFINQLLQFMGRIVPSSSSGILGSGKDVYQSLFEQELSKNMAKKGGLKIGEMVYKQMISREEKKLFSAGTMNPLPPMASGSGEK